MEWFIVHKYGKDKKLELAEIPEPIVKENEVLLQIHSAGVNPLDSLIKNGDFKIFLNYKPSFILGHDVAGIIIKVGSKVNKFKVWDEIYARLPDYHIWAFAEYVSINETYVALKPKNLSMEQASSIPLVGLTSWQALVEIANLKKWQKVFIQAWSGGVGTFAIQLAKYLGATVATSTSSANIDFVKSLGADIVIDYKNEDFEEKLKDYDLVLHSNKDVKILKKSLNILKSGWKLISLIGPPTPEFVKEIGLPWYLQLVTKFLSYEIKKKAKKINVWFNFLFMKADGKQLDQITKLIESGIIKPVLDKVFPFKQTNEAMKYVESGKARGKVVIKIK